MLDSRLRVVFIAPFARSPKATTSARVIPLARALAGRGHDVTVLVPPYDNPAESGQRCTAGGAAVVALPVDERIPEQSPLQAVVQPRLAAQLVQRARALHPDVIHVCKPKAVSGLAQLLLWYQRRLVAFALRPRSTGGNVGNGAAPLQRRPALVLDTDDWEGDGGWNEYEAYPWWQKRVCDWQERWGLEHADAVTTASRTLQAQAWSHGVPPPRVHYLPNGLDPSDYPGWLDADAGAARAELDVGDGPLLLLYTRFFEFGPERAVEILDRVRRRVASARLLVVGAGKFGQERVLVELAARRGLGDAVVAAGWQPFERLPGFLAAADVALFPADDNLANRAKCSAKVLEALWLRRAVVADSVGQYAEYVRDGRTGLLSDPADPASMAEAAVRLLHDRPLADRLGAAGHQRVVREFNWDTLASAAERAYAAALT